MEWVCMLAIAISLGWLWGERSDNTRHLLILILAIAIITGGLLLTLRV